MESFPTQNATNNIATSQQTQNPLNTLIMNNLREKLAAAMQHNNPLKLRKFESVTLRFLGEIESSENSQILTFSSKAYGWRAVLIELFRLYDAYKVRTPYHLAFCLYDKISVKAPQIEFAKAVKAQYFHHNSAIGGTLRDPSESPLDWLVMLDALASEADPNYDEGKTFNDQMLAFAMAWIARERRIQKLVF